jgi:hypothetical protein
MSRAVCCERCQSVGLDRYINGASLKLGLLLLLLFVVPGVLYFAWFLLSSHRGCGTCGSRHVVPLMQEAASPVEPAGTLAGSSQFVTAA